MAKAIVCCTVYYPCGCNPDGSAMVCAQTVCKEVDVPDQPKTPGGQTVALTYTYPASFFADFARELHSSVSTKANSLAKRKGARRARVVPYKSFLSVAKQRTAIAKLRRAARA